jgi:hypothetical protein
VCGFSSQELYLYITENEDFHYQEDRNFLLWNEELNYGNWEDGPNKDGTRTKTLDILVPESVQNNGTWYIHIFISKAGSTLDSDSKDYKEQSITYQSTCEEREREREREKRGEGGREGGMDGWITAISRLLFSCV